MALADTARLVASLELDSSKFAAGARKAEGALGGLEGRFSRIGGIASKGLQTAAHNLSRIGIVAGGALATFGVASIKSGLDSLSELEDATTSVTGAIEAMGLQGKLTAQQVAGWANQIESDVGAAFDDKAITAAAATLLRFGKVVPENLQQSLVVMTDLAAKTGDVDSAASLLAKALADPTNAAGKLARAGVILTDEQKKQVKALNDAGDAAGAQKVLLDALAQSTKGAAAASQGPYQRALSTLRDTWEDVTRALAVGFLPVLTKISEYLKGKLADPGFLKKVEGFGQTLADALSKALDAAKNIPWGTIGDAMKLAGQGAKAAYDLFNGLPDWLKTAVLTGWGLNKLTGGALGGIVGELGKGLIKGVLGINAGVVNINAGTVNGAPGAGGAAGGAGATGTRLGGALNTAVTVGGAALIGQEAFALPGALSATKTELDALSNHDLPAAGDALRELGKIIGSLPGVSGAGLFNQISGDVADGVDRALNNNNAAIAAHIASEIADRSLNIKAPALDAELSTVGERVQSVRNAINNKNWTPTINTTVVNRINNEFKVSARTLAQQMTVFRTTSHNRLGSTAT